jgi:predicted ArsR family transcriptional regulator
MPIPRRSDLDLLAYELQCEGKTLAQIADRLGVTPEMVRRRVNRHKRLPQEAVTEENGSGTGVRLKKGLVQ